MSTGKKSASDAGKLLGNKDTPQKVKEVAASVLAQAKAKSPEAPRESTGEVPASDAGRLLGDKSTPQKVKEIAASDLAQAKKSPVPPTPPAKKK